MKNLNLFAFLFVVVGIVSCSKEANFVTELGTDAAVDFRTERFIEGSFEVTDVYFAGLSQKLDEGTVMMAFKEETNQYSLTNNEEVCQGEYSLVDENDKMSVAFSTCTKEEESTDISGGNPQGTTLTGGNPLAGGLGGQGNGFNTTGIMSVDFMELLNDANLQVDYIIANAETVDFKLVIGENDEKELVGMKIRIDETTYLEMVKEKE